MGGAKPIKVMYLNPVGNGDHDSAVAEMARDHKLPGTEVHVASLPSSEGGFTHIEYRSYEAMLTRGIIRAVRAAAREGFDAMAIGCFYDTALHHAREISDHMVVTAPCVSSCEIAAGLSNRFGIVVARRKWVHQMHDTVRDYGHEHRVSGFYHVEPGANDDDDDLVETERRFIEAGRKAVEEDYAEALILGCTPGVGFYKQVEEKLGVPVIDPSIAALKRAEYGAVLRRQCGWVPSRKWSTEALPEEELACFGRFHAEEPFGNRIVVGAA